MMQCCFPQPLDQLPIHMAATRFSGGLFHVQQLLKISGKDARIAQDKVSVFVPQRDPVGQS